MMTADLDEREEAQRKLKENESRQLIERRHLRQGSVVEGTITASLSEVMRNPWIGFVVVVDGIECIATPRDLPEKERDGLNLIGSKFEFVVVGTSLGHFPCPPFERTSPFGSYMATTINAECLRLCEKSVFVARRQEWIGRVVDYNPIADLYDGDPTDSHPGCARPRLGLATDDCVVEEYEGEDTGLYLIKESSTECGAGIVCSCKEPMEKVYQVRVSRVTHRGLVVEGPSVKTRYGSGETYKFLIPRKHVDINPVGDLNDYLGERLDVKILEVFDDEIFFSHRLVQEERLKEKGSTATESCAMPKKVILDGKNIMAYGSDRKTGVKACHVSYLITIISALEAAKVAWFCFFDANTPMYVEEAGSDEDKHLYTELMARFADSITCVNGGHEADDDILFKADREHCDVISRDNYQKPKYIERYPWLRIKDAEGRYLDGIKRRVHSFVIAEGEIVIQSLGLSARITNRLDAVVCEKPAMDRNACRKESVENVWQRIISEYSVGQSVVRPVGKVVPALGVFVKLEPDFDGLIHISKIAGLDGRNPHDFFKAGQDVTVRIASIDQKTHRVQLATSLTAVPQPERYTGTMSEQDEREAVEWLEKNLSRAPLHGSLLCELTRRWHVPKPVSAFVGSHGFFYFPPNNKYSPHPAAVKPEFVDSPVYWGKLVTRLPIESNDAISIPSSPSGAQTGNPSGKQKVEPDNLKSGMPEAKKPILIDGSNIIRYFADLRSKALAFPVEGLEANGFMPVVLFDANISYVLKDNGDTFGLELFERFKRERPESTIVVPSGMRSDDYLLLLADKRGYPIISCDTYKDEAYAQYAWLKNREVTGEKRVHAPTFVLGDLVIPTLGIVWPIGK